MKYRKEVSMSKKTDHKVQVTPLKGGYYAVTFNASALVKLTDLLNLSHPEDKDIGRLVKAISIIEGELQKQQKN